MKKRLKNGHPGLGDFKNKCSARLKSYDAALIRLVYESVYEAVYFQAHSTKPSDLVNTVAQRLLNRRIIILHLSEIVLEILDYLSDFFLLLDSVRAES